jgi:hypothetical protein
MFGAKVGAYPNGASYVTPLNGWALALPTNIRVGWNLLKVVIEKLAAEQN